MAGLRGGEKKSKMGAVVTEVGGDSGNVVEDLELLGKNHGEEVRLLMETRQ